MQAFHSGFKGKLTSPGPGYHPLVEGEAAAASCCKLHIFSLRPQTAEVQHRELKHHEITVNILLTMTSIVAALIGIGITITSSTIAAVSILTIFITTRSLLIAVQNTILTIAVICSHCYYCFVVAFVSNVLVLI